MNYEDFGIDAKTASIYREYDQRGSCADRAISYNYINGKLVEILPTTDKGEPRLVILFSCGITSFIAAKIAMEENRKGENLPVHLIYTYVRNEPEDNLRFLSDAQDYLGQKVRILASAKYYDIYHVQIKTGWIVGPAGARCTKELKWQLRVDFTTPEDLQVFGFDSAEQGRKEKFQKNNPDVDLECPLLERGLSKDDCFLMAAEIGVSPSDSYKDGNHNANCKGCVKGGAGYWNNERIANPLIFHKQAIIERKKGAAINKRYITLRPKTEQKIRDELAKANKPFPEDAKDGDSIRIPVYLDSLDPEAGRYEPINLPDCGVICSTESGVKEVDLVGMAE